MRSALPVALAAAGLLALVSVHCGGQVGAQPSPTDCPADVTTASCASGGQCKQHYSDCQGNHELTCNCASGRWSCPALGVPFCPPADECASAKNGGACATQDLFCRSKVQPNCPQPTNDGCLCKGGKFVCSATICGEPPPVPACPPPSAIQEGGSCGAPVTCAGELQCPKGGKAGVKFDCVNGRWQMWEYFVDPCELIAVDAGGGG